MTRTPSRLELFLAFLSWLQAAALGSTTVLCAGADGHVAYEVLGAPCCDHGTSLPSEAGPVSSAARRERGPGGGPPRPGFQAERLSDPGCSDCTDLSFAAALPSVRFSAGAEELRAAGAPGGAPASDVFAVPPAGADGGATAARAFAARSPGAARGALSHLSSQILRC